MKKLFLAAGLLALASCSGSESKKSSEAANQKPALVAASLPAYHVSQVAHSANLLLTTATYTGVIMRDEQPKTWVYGPKVRAVTPAEVMQAEAILQHCASPKQVTWYWYKSGVDSLDGKRQQQANAIAALHLYSRQYVGLRTATGQRVVWINAFPATFSGNWKTAGVYVDDGGMAFFNIYVNLDTNQCFNFERNGNG